MAMLSVITPTYNRAGLLARCFESLRKQTCHDFEWIIIDDGSTDDTEAVVGAFDTELFPITYVKKENGGKHTALNASHQYIQGDYVLILDSDDYLTPDAVGNVTAVWNEYINDKDIAVISFYKMSESGKIFSSTVEQRLISDNISYRVNQRKKGDQCEVVRAGYFNEFIFPVYEGEKFASEALLWNYLGYRYKTVYENKAIYICEYLEGGITGSGRRLLMKNPRAMIDLTKSFFDPRVCQREQIKQMWLYIVYSFCDRRSFAKTLRDSGRPIRIMLNYPIGAILYCHWRRKYL